MVPKRTETSDSGQPGSAVRSPDQPQTTSNIPSPPPASELARPAEPDVSSNESAANAETANPQALTAADVTEAIEHERVELMQIQSMLKCLYEVLLYADDDDSVMHADVANVCARLISDSVDRLSHLLMQGAGHSSSDELDESGKSNLCGSEEE